MILFIRYTSGLGDSEIYTRLRDATGQFWNFTELTWAGSLTEDCKVYLTESSTDDLDPVDSYYSKTADLPAGGPWVEETVLNSTGKVIGYGNTEQITDSQTLNLKQTLFAYPGHVSNLFSKVSGSYVGTVDFYCTSYTDFSNNMTDPGGDFICSLSAAGIMLDQFGAEYPVDSLPVVSGEVLYFKYSTSFQCLLNTTINIFNYINKGSIRVYIPKDLNYNDVIVSYYPTSGGGLLVYQNGNLIHISESMYGRAIAMIPSINWDNISQPVQLTTTAVIV